MVSEGAVERERERENEEFCFIWLTFLMSEAILDILALWDSVALPIAQAIAQLKAYYCTDMNIIDVILLL